MEKLGWDQSKYVTNEDVLNWMITRKAELTNVSSPNTHFAYCNTNYALLALLIEKVSGKKYPVFMQENFFIPLNMKHSFVFDTSMATKVNPSYNWRCNIIPLNFLDAVYGDKNIYTTPGELFLWDRAISSGKIFSDKTMQEAYTPYSNEKPGIRNYGLGWRMNIYPAGKKMIYHNGWWHGDNAAFIRLPDEDATIIVMGNKFNRSIYHAKDLANLFSNYFGHEEEEETEPMRPADTMEAILANTVATPKKK
jgi:CubicO group peptidase (beta-lactamase class C family)